MADSKIIGLDAALLANTAANPARVAFQDHAGKLTAGELAVFAFLLGKHISSLTKAPTVGICLPTIKEYSLAAFGTIFAGKTVVPINFLLQPHELAHVFKDSGLDLVITASLFKDKLAPLGVKTLLVEDLAALKPTGAPPQPQPCATPAEIAVLLYTSGTTALPKGVQLTHANFLAQMKGIGGVFNLERFHLLCALPLFHTLPLTVCMMLPALTQARASFLPQFDPAKFVEMMPKFGANVMLGVPSMYRGVARAARLANLDAKALGVEIAVAGGEKLPAEAREAFGKQFGLELLEGYGLTEHSPAVCLNRPGRNRPGSIGEPIPGVQVRIADGDNKPLPHDAEGELQCKSASVMRGYKGLPASEQPFTADGWLKTGDLAKLSADGYVTITGRIKELIIAAGKNIHPAEIEVVVAQHPAVDECAVISMPDKAHGEAPACFVVLKKAAELEPEALKVWLRDKLAEYKQPKLVKILPQLPHGPTGKVFKRALKEHLPQGG